MVISGICYDEDTREDGGRIQVYWLAICII